MPSARSLLQRLALRRPRAALPGEFPLTDAQVRHYREQGFLQLPGVLSPEETAQAQQALDAAMGMQLREGLDRTGQRSGYDRVFLQKVNLWRDHAGIRRLVLSERLAGPARRLCGAEAVRLWHDHALIKPHVDSKPSPWHQDLPYWPMGEPGALSCWLALDDVDETNGCMRFVPQSHTWGRLQPINLADPQDLFALVPEPEDKDFTPVSMPMRAGSCTFHHGLTFHSAPANQGSAPRRALVIIYMPDGTTFTGRPHPVTHDLPLAVGEPITGERFPLLACRA